MLNVLVCLRYTHSREPDRISGGAVSVLLLFAEEARIHVHVICASGEAKFWLDPAVEPVMSKGISARESRAIQRIIERRKEEIVRAWRQHFAS